MNNAALPVFLLRLLLFAISIVAHYLMCLMLRSGNLRCRRCSIASTMATAAGTGDTEGAGTVWVRLNKFICPNVTKK
jgi:hypothetical protein